MRSKVFCFCFFMIAASLAQGQWRYQLGIGSNLSTGDIEVKALLSDTLEYRFFKSGLPFVSGSFTATYPIREGLLLRMGVDGTKAVIDIEVYDTKNRRYEYSERRSIIDMHLPVEIQYGVSKSLWLNAGASLGARLEPFRIPLSEQVRYNKPSNDPWVIDDFEEAVYSAIREFSANWRFGTTLKFTDWLAVDMFYDRPISNLLATPLVVNGDSQKVKFKYSSLSLRVIYVFEWKKLKAKLNN